jgi:hypothetical protein
VNANKVGCYLAEISRTLMEYGGKLRENFELRPSTFEVTGTTLAGSVMVLVSSGLLPLSCIKEPSGSTVPAPWSSI